MTDPLDPLAPVPPPTAAQVRDWTKISSTSITDDQLDQLLASELANQYRVCRTDPYTADLYQAALRRCARQLAARGIPLGLVGTDAEYGPSKLPSFDAEIERLEGPVRKFVFG